MKSAERAYHHGDLRAAVMAAGLKLLEAGRGEDLSLREIARNVQVSATAIYRHFPDKTALLRALAAAGAERLGDEQKAAYEAAGGGAPGFAATGRAYVRFALKNPALFRLIMSFSPKDQDGAPEVEGSSAMRFLRRNVASFLPSDASARERRVQALRAWSMVHGVAMLMLDGQVAADDALIDALIDEHTAAPR